MARTANPDKVKNVPLSGSITEVEREAVEEYIWNPDVRMKFPEFVASAVRDKIAELGLDLDAAKARLEAADKS